MSDHLQQLKEILIEDAGTEAVKKLTDDDIRQFEKVLYACAEILYHRSKNGCPFDLK